MSSQTNKIKLRSSRTPIPTKNPIALTPPSEASVLRGKRKANVNYQPEKRNKKKVISKKERIYRKLTIPAPARIVTFSRQQYRVEFQVLQSVFADVVAGFNWMGNFNIIMDYLTFQCRLCNSRYRGDVVVCPCGCSCNEECCEQCLLSLPTRFAAMDRFGDFCRRCDRCELFIMGRLCDGDVCIKESIYWSTAGLRSCAEHRVAIHGSLINQLCLKPPIMRDTSKLVKRCEVTYCESRATYGELDLMIPSRCLAHVRSHYFQVDGPRRCVVVGCELYACLGSSPPLLNSNFCYLHIRQMRGNVFL